MTHKDIEYAAAALTLRDLDFNEKDGIFVQNLPGASIWVSLLNNFGWTSLLVGPLFADINRKSYWAIGEATSGAIRATFPAKWGPPLFHFQFDAIDEIRRQFCPDRTLNFKSTNEAIETMLKEMSGFLDLKKAVEKAMELNCFGQTQLYFIPVALLELGQLEEYNSYTQRALAHLDHEFRKTYECYLSILEGGGVR